jgi:hypothetical protein
MKRTTVNFVVDTVAFAGFVFLISTGMLLRYLLPPGSGRTEGLGVGHGAADKPVSLLWGLSRHEWGSVHFYIALTIMAVLAVHLVLHWNWIVCTVRGKPREGSGFRVALGFFGLVVVILLAAAPLVSSVEEISRGQRKGPPVGERQDGRPRRDEAAPRDDRQLRGAPAGQGGRQSGETLPGERPGRAEHGEADHTIRGSMTLGEMEQATGVPILYLTQELNLPDGLSPDERLGPLGRRYGFAMEEVRRVIAQYPGESVEDPDAVPSE